MKLNVNGNNPVPDKFVKQLLNQAVEHYNKPSFIPDDPISLVHLAETQQDKEIIGFWVSMIAWGQRKTIVNNGLRLMDMMDGRPHHFVMHHKPSQLAVFEKFVHRTFQPLDALYFIHWFRCFYHRHSSLEEAFTGGQPLEGEDTGPALQKFHALFFSLPEAPKRTMKHVAAPYRQATCKRLNMFLRWMVRHDDRGVDLGLWKQISPRQLLIPLDVHVDKTARRLGLINRRQTDWKAVTALTETLRTLDPDDPVKYDFALFGLGIEERLSRS